MRAALLLLLSVLFVTVDSACVTGYTAVGNKCLKLYAATATHTSAEATCAVDGATLATAKNAIDNRAIATFVGTSVTQIWLGLYCLGNDPAKCFWDDATGSADNYNNFAKSFPYVEIGSCSYYIVTGSLAGQWMSAGCMDSHSFVCELPATVSDTCNYNYNGYCYAPSRATTYGLLDFSQAQQACEHLGMNLASIHSQNEMLFIKSIHKGSNAADDIIVGGLQYSTNSFGWTDSTPWDYNNFATTYSRGCVHVSLSPDTSGVWSVKDCETSGRFLCKRPAGTPAPVTVTPSPTNPPSCNTPILMNSGVFTSPGYPGYYPLRISCTYSLATVANNQILLTFSKFSTIASYDVVSIYDGDSTSSPLIRTLTGLTGTYTVPFSVKSSGNRMFVVFKVTYPNSNIYGTGFYANFLSLV